jgi:hypothetical protein
MAILARPEALSGDVLIRPARPGEEDVVLDLLAAACYVSRLAVARHGVHLGHRVIDRVAAKAAERGVRCVRLATASDNPALRRYYERAGFVHVADPPHARWPTSLYERTAVL